MFSFLFDLEPKSVFMSYYISEENRNSITTVFFSGQRMLEEFQTHLDEETARKDEAEEQLEGSSKILLKVRSGIEHLSEKLKHLKAVSTLF